MLQFEEVDNLKMLPSLSNPTNTQGPSVTDSFATDTTAELIMFDNEPVTTIQSTYNTTSPPSATISTMRKTLSSSSMNNNNVANLATLSLNNPNHPLSHLQSSTTASTTTTEQSLGGNPFNPFDVKIKKPSFKGFWPNRKEKSKKTKLQKTNQKQNIYGTQLDDSTSVNSHNSALVNNDNMKDSLFYCVYYDFYSESNENNIGKIIGSIDGLNQLSSPTMTTATNALPNVTKSKCPTPEPYSREKSSPQTSDNRQLYCKSTVPFSSMSNNRQQQSSQSSTSSDEDDDDYPMAKIQFKINPAAKTTTTNTTEISNESKISDAMRQVDKNIGHIATYSRATGRVSNQKEWSFFNYFDYIIC
ncbi:unnamed protein product, partial [Didymodactylos carnosus]